MQFLKNDFAQTGLKRNFEFQFALLGKLLSNWLKIHVVLVVRKCQVYFLSNPSQTESFFDAFLINFFLQYKNTFSFVKQRPRRLMFLLENLMVVLPKIDTGIQLLARATFLLQKYVDTIMSKFVLYSETGKFSQKC